MPSECFTFSISTWPFLQVGAFARLPAAAGHAEFCLINSTVFLTNSFYANSITGSFFFHCLFVLGLGYHFLKVKDSSGRTKHLIMSMAPSSNSVRVKLNIDTTLTSGCCWSCWRHPLVFPHRGVSSNDFPCLETLCKKIMKEKQPFERLEIKKETLLEMFKVSESATWNVDVKLSNFETRPPLGSTTSSSVASWTRRSPPRPPPFTGEATNHCGVLGRPEML